MSKYDPRQTLANNIKRIRSERELSQAALSVISETRLPGISELENANKINIIKRLFIASLQ